jgi:hypothetical protein
LPCYSPTSRLRSSSIVGVHPPRHSLSSSNALNRPRSCEAGSSRAPRYCPAKLLSGSVKRRQDANGFVPCQYCETTLHRCRHRPEILLFPILLQLVSSLIQKSRGYPCSIPCQHPTSSDDQVTSPYAALSRLPCFASSCQKNLRAPAKDASASAVIRCRMPHMPFLLPIYVLDLHLLCLRTVLSSSE